MKTPFGVLLIGRAPNASPFSRDHSSQAARTTFRWGLPANKFSATKSEGSQTYSISQFQRGHLISLSGENRIGRALSERLVHTQTSRKPDGSNGKRLYTAAQL